MDKIVQYGLIGKKLSHSFSKGYFTRKFEDEKIFNRKYSLFELEKISEIKSIIQNTPLLMGLNVTIPYKQAVIPFLTQLSSAAQEIGAVNCININKQQLIGHNTDAYGFETSLQPLLHSNIKSALVFGTGGASKAICYVLKKLNIKFQLVSRKSHHNVISYSEITPQLMQENLLLINTTPLGMFPKITESPSLPYHLITSKHILYDLVYNPENTTFLTKGAQQMATIKNGLEMLHLQAEKSWEIWNSSSPDSK